jgi:hypothetical protein
MMWLGISGGLPGEYARLGLAAAVPAPKATVPLKTI